MVLMGAINILVKGLSVVLLGMIDKRWALTYILSDNGLYLFIKVTRGDFYYWMAFNEAPMIVVLLISFIERVAVKVIIDFTSLGKELHVDR